MQYRRYEDEVRSLMNTFIFVLFCVASYLFIVRYLLLVILLLLHIGCSLYFYCLLLVASYFCSGVMQYRRYEDEVLSLINIFGFVLLLVASYFFIVGYWLPVILLLLVICCYLFSYCWLFVDRYFFIVD